MKRKNSRAISTRIPKELKLKLQKCVEKFGYINESDFIREAIRTHIFALEKATSEKGAT